MPAASNDFEKQLSHAFAAIEVGQSFTFRRTFTDGDLSLFCNVTGDYNPYHIDQSFAAASWFGQRILPGLLTASMVTHIGGMLGFLAKDMHFTFQAPVFINDTITCKVTISDKNEENHLVTGVAELSNQRGETVLQASFCGFPGLIRLAPDTPGPE